MEPPARKTDAELQRDVMEELRWDTRVRQPDVGVEVQSGVVTLSGTVDTWSARLAAQEAAHRVAGVLDVANEIGVKVARSHQRTDADVAKAVRTALEWDVLVPHERIHTTVSNGVVTLEGDVDFWSQHDDAEKAIGNLPGIREVKNLVVVRPAAPRPSTSTVRAAVEGALLRRAEHAARRVQIAVVDGTVTLSGDVTTWAERRALEGAARGTPGVRAVENRLAVRAV